MNPQLITIIAGASISLLAIGGVLWWMNRAPRVRKEADGILPLFGADYDPSRRLVLTERPAPQVSASTAASPSATAVAQASAPAAVSTFAPAPAPVTATPRAPSQSPTSSPAVEVPGAAGSAARSVEARSILAERAAAYAAAADATAAAKAAMSAAMEASSTVEPIPPTIPAPAKSTPILEFHTRGRPAAPSAPTIPPSTRSPQSSPAIAANTPVVNNAGVPGTMVEGQLLRFSVPAEGTLQFLPGRLEIAAGLDAGREIRFVNVPGPDGTIVTFGRSDGELYRHIQLRDQTVSRSHARMRLVDSRWQLLNLSQTNPVVHNGRVLDSGEEHALDDGDRIEMGEVLFTFRSR